MQCIMEIGVSKLKLNPEKLANLSKEKTDFKTKQWSPRDLEDNNKSVIEVPEIEGKDCSVGKKF